MSDSIKHELQRINDLFKHSSCILSHRELGWIVLQRIFQILESIDLSSPHLVEITLETLQQYATSCPSVLEHGILDLELLISIFKHCQQTLPDLNKLCCSTILSLCMNDRICHCVENLLKVENVLDSFIQLCLENQFQLSRFTLKWENSLFDRRPNIFSKMFIGSKTLVEFSSSVASPTNDFIQFSTSKYPPKALMFWRYVRKSVEQDEESTRNGYDFLNLKLIHDPAIRVDLRFYPTFKIDDGYGSMVTRIFKHKEKLDDPTNLELNSFISAGIKFDPANEDDHVVEIVPTGSSFSFPQQSQMESLKIHVDSDLQELPSYYMERTGELITMETSCVKHLSIHRPFSPVDFVSILSPTIERSSLVHLDIYLDEHGFDFTPCFIQTLPKIFKTLRSLCLHHGAAGLDVSSLVDILCSSDCNLAQLTVIYHGKQPAEMVGFITSILRLNQKLLSMTIKSNKFALHDQSMQLISEALEESSILHFDLSQCLFDDKGLKCLTHARSSTLTCMDLSGTRTFTDEDLFSIANAISSPNWNVSKLKLDSSSPSAVSNGAMAILTALKSPYNKITFLDLPCCDNFGDFGAKMFADIILDPNCKLIAASICFWNISSRGLEAIAKSCQNKHTKLLHLVLEEEETNFDQESMIELGKAIFYGKVEVLLRSYHTPSISKVSGLFESWVWRLVSTSNKTEMRKNSKAHIALTLTGSYRLPNEICRLIINTMGLNRED